MWREDFWGKECEQSVLTVVVCCLFLWHTPLFRAMPMYGKKENLKNPIKKFSKSF
jgi:hypothetical protein